MTDPLASTHSDTGRPLVNPAIATAAVAVCLGVPGNELALIGELEQELLSALPTHATVGYAADALTGEIFPPGAALPAGRRLFASIRIALPRTSPDEVLDTLAAIAANGWRIERAPRLAMALDRSVPVLRARPQDLPAGAVPGGINGRGVLLGVVDFGCDFAHKAFLTESGQTRLEFLWDQNAAPAAGGPVAGPVPGPVPGATYERAAIDAALLQPDPYAALGYRPDANSYAPPLARGGNIVHGTHVLGVAAGRGMPDCPAGVAPGASLAFVHLQPGALVANGDPADVFDGVCAIFARAAALGMPAVVNLSLGANSGSHDGDSLFDRALDAVLAAPGRAISVSAGNERQARLHTDGTVTAGAPVRLQWRFAAGDPTQNALRVFCAAPNAVQPLQCSIHLEGAELSSAMAEGQNTQTLMRGGQPIGIL